MRHLIGITAIGIACACFYWLGIDRESFWWKLGDLAFFLAACAVAINYLFFGWWPKWTD